MYFKMLIHFPSKETGIKGERGNRGLWEGKKYETIIAKNSSVQNN